MRLATMLRISPAVWIGPIIALLAVLYINILPETPDPYLLGLTVKATLTMFLVAPVCAASAAWEAGRLRRAGWWELPHVRPPLIVALISLVPVLVMGFLVITAVVIFTLLGAGVVAVPDLRIVIMTFAIIAAHTLLGFAIGLHVRPVVAVPAVLLVDYGWMTLPRVLEPPWLRHLNGAWIAGFGVGIDVALVAIAGTVVVAGGLAGTAIFLLRRHIDVPRYILAVMPTVLAFIIGTALVRGLGYDPFVPRNASLLVCSSTQPRVCVWPEHRARLEEVSEIASDAAKRWQKVSITVPSEFSERTSLSPDERSFSFNLASQRSDIIGSLAYSLLPTYPACTLDEPPPYPGAPFAEEYIFAWLAATAGMPQADLATRANPDALSTVAMVQSLPSDRQQSWLKQNLAAWQSCKWPPRVEASR